MKESVIRKLRCPNCLGSGAVISVGDIVANCLQCDTEYPLASGRPVFLRPDNELFSTQDYANTEYAGAANESLLQRITPTPSVNLSEARVLENMCMRLKDKGNASVLVVGSGTQRALLQKHFYAARLEELVCCDIDVGADVDLFCDAHSLPFVDGAFDAVITTAVLEHVMYPEQVAMEITRVLSPGGLLYSELPFIQQVHEGAYDFTRYTLSGHRRLFNSFAEIEAGMVAGPGTALLWTIENFATSFFSGRISRMIAKSASRILFWWIKYFDYILRSNPAAMDAASCTYFFGFKADKPISAAQIIAKYVGGQSLKHN